MKLHRVLVASAVLGVLVGAASTRAQADADVAASPKRPWNELDASWISARLVFQAFEDGAFFSQDPASKEQVGDLSSTALFRVDDLLLTGQIKFPHPWTFAVGGSD